jgi:hypothetical protein
MAEKQIRKRSSTDEKGPVVSVKKPKLSQLTKQDFYRSNDVINLGIKLLQPKEGALTPNYSVEYDAFQLLLKMQHKFLALCKSVITSQTAGEKMLYFPVFNLLALISFGEAVKIGSANPKKDDDEQTEEVEDDHLDLKKIEHEYQMGYNRVEFVTYWPNSDKISSCVEVKKSISGNIYDEKSTLWQLLGEMLKCYIINLQSYHMTLTTGKDCNHCRSASFELN